MQVNFSRGSVHFDSPSPVSVPVAIADGTLQFVTGVAAGTVGPFAVLQQSVVEPLQWAWWLSDLDCTSTDSTGTSCIV